MLLPTCVTEQVEHHFGPNETSKDSQNLFLKDSFHSEVQTLAVMKLQTHCLSQPSSSLV